MPLCPKCLEPVPILNEWLITIVEEWAETPEGRKRIRELAHKVDCRTKAKPPRVSKSNSTLLSRIVQHLIKVRVESGLSQAALAQKIGVSDWTVHRWENGKGPGIDQCSKWANALGMSLVDVLQVIERTV